MPEANTNHKHQVTVDYQPVGKRVQAAIGQTVLAAAQGLTLFEHSVSAPCGGKGLCGRCLIKLISGHLSPPSAFEINQLTSERLNQHYRLACQARLLSSCKIEIPPASLVGRQQLKVTGEHSEFAVDYHFNQYTVDGLQKPSLHFPYSRWQQIENQLTEKYGRTQLNASLNLMCQAELNETETNLVVSVCHNEIVAISPAGTDYHPLGLAIDLGTTKIAAFLVSLATGRILASEGLLNPQISYGEDVMSRLAFALESAANAQQLAAAATDGINQLTERLTTRLGYPCTQIKQVVIVANTAMHHLLLGLPLKQLACSPYIPTATSPITLTARTIGLNLSSEAEVYMPALVGGFVGSDHVTMIQACGIDETHKVILGIDIGTNTEIVLTQGGKRLTACSCASGPAFEGAHIYQGMRAVDGAISQVSLSNNGLEVVVATIGGKRPLGLCGSGIIDLVAQLATHHIISANGKLDPDHPRVRIGGAQLPEFVIVPQADSGCDTDIVITQHDISEIQLAKAAIASSISILLANFDLALQTIDKVIIAGAFGSFLNIDSAIAIGLLPKLPSERFTQVGNAAGSGACMNLVSSHERQRNHTLARKIEHLDLAIHPGFKREFAKALKFPIVCE